MLPVLTITLPGTSDLAIGLDSRVSEGSSLCLLNRERNRGMLEIAWVVSRRRPLQCRGSIPFVFLRRDKRRVGNSGSDGQDLRGEPIGDQPDGFLSAGRAEPK